MLTHQCKQNRFSQTGIQIIFGPSVDENWNNWILRVARFTHTKDVHDGEASEVGEALCTHEFVIHYCPFCGIELSHLNKDQP